MMLVKELKFILEELDDEQEIIFRSQAGIEWEPVIDKTLFGVIKYKKKPKMYIEVK